MIIRKEEHRINKDLLNEIFNGYKIGDIVYRTELEYEKQYGCDVCNNTGKTKAIVKGKEVNIECPYCYHGYKGAIPKYKPVKCKIQKMQLEVCEDDRIRICLETSEDFYGDVIRPMEIFCKSKEECMKKCKELLNELFEKYKKNAKEQ